MISNQEAELIQNVQQKADNIKICRKTNEDELVYDHQIQLNLKNMVNGKLPNKQNALCLVDSGASVSVISRGLINKSTYLQNIPIETCPNVRIMTAGGNILTTTLRIKFKFLVQNHIFDINAFILPNLGGVDIVLGSRGLSQIDAKLNFRKNTLKWKSRSVLAKVMKDIILQPGTTKTIKIFAKLPESLKNAEVYLQVTKYMQNICPSLSIVSMRKNSSFITVTNNTNRKITIKSHKPIGVILIKRFGEIAVEAPLKVESTLQCAQRIMCEELCKNGAEHLHSIVNSPQDHRTGEYYPMAKPPPFCKGNHNIPNHLTKAQKEMYVKKSKLYPYLNCDDPRLWTDDIDILEKSLNFKDSKISNKSAQQLWEIVKRNIKAYSLHDDIGQVKDMSIKIELSDDTPFFVRPYSATEEEKEIINRELQKLVLLGVIKRGMSSYCCPVFLLKKPHEKSGTYRVLGDFRTINQRINSLHCAAPLLRDCLPVIGASKATIFSSLDIKAAFYSIPLDENSQKYINICSYPGGPTYNYLRVPQGCNISPAEYNNVMSRIMDDVPCNNKNVLYIADDVLIFSKTEKEHLTHIDQVLKAFAKHGLKVAPGKCEYFKDSINYMGHIISSKQGYPTIQAQKSKIDAIRNLPTPKNAKETKSWVGMVSYLSQYVPYIQVLLKPIHKNTRKNCRFNWTTECDNNFKKVNEIIQSNHVLTLPTSDGRMKLYVDSSLIGMGSCLMQTQNGVDRVLAFYSKKLPESVKRYGITEVEMLGIWTAVHAFRFLLRGKHFDVFTDHNPAVQISVSKNEIPSVRLRKLYLKLSDYSFKMHYRKGINMYISDYLSRNPESEIHANDAIAFPMVTPVTKCNNCHNNIYDNWHYNTLCQSCIRNNEDATEEVFVVTRSSTRAEGAALLPGLPPATRQRRSAAGKPSSSVPNAPAVVAETGTPTTVEGRVTRSQTREMPAADHIDSSQPELVVEKPAETLVEQPIANTEPLVQGLAAEHESLIRPDLVDARRVNTIPSIYIPDTEHIPSNVPIVARTPREVTYRTPEDEYYVKPRDLFNPNIPIEKWFYKALPKGSDLQKLLENIKSRYITDTHLPIEKQVLAQQQREDPDFKHIYAYIRLGILPDKKNQQRKILSQCEHFAMADDILFKIDVAVDHATGKQYLRKRVCIPEKFVPYLLHIYHESLLSCHVGIEKTYMNLKERFYIKHLVQRVTDWIRSCCVCQSIKQDKTEPRIMEGRFPTSYNPFEEISIDIKYMIPGVNGYNFLLVACCNVTRYVMATPLKRADAVNIAEALVNLVFTWGPPRIIFMDMDKGFSNQLANFLYNALGIKRTVISPFAHSSLLVERHIGTITRFITSNLIENGKYWPLYVKPALYAYNTSPIKGLSVSPYELVFGRKAPMLHNVKFTPVEDVKTNYRDYAQWIKNRIQAISNHLAQIRTESQLDAVSKDALRVNTMTKYVKGSIVYLNAPQISNLITSSKKIKMTYVGPLIVSEVIGTDKVILEDIFGRKLHGIHSFNRLKQGYIRLERGVASTIDELKKAINESEFHKIQTNTHLVDQPTNQPAIEGLHSLFEVSTRSNSLTPTGSDKNPTRDKLIALPCLSLTVVHIHLPDHYFKGEPKTKLDFSKYTENLKENGGLAFKMQIPEYKKARIIAQNNKKPLLGSELTITKARYQMGILQLLLTSDYKSKGNKYSFWYSIENPTSEVDRVLKTMWQRKKIKTCGSPLKFDRSFSDAKWKPAVIPTGET